jgi:antitoxin YefM
MPVETTYTKLRDELASFLDRVIDDQEVVIVKRRGAKDVALVPADELSSLMETAYLLSSPRNAERLFRAQRRSARGEGKPMTLDQLRKEIGIAEER